MSSLESRSLSEATPSSVSPAWAWTFTAAWALFVWELGSDGLSLESTSRFLGPMIRWLLPDIATETSDLVQLAIRKAAHVTEYGVLAFFAFRAFLASGWAAMPRAAVAAFVLATVFAAADETRQSLSATRLGSALDVGLDALGAALAVGLLLLVRTTLPHFGAWLGLSERSDEAPPTGAETGTIK